MLGGRSWRIYDFITATYEVQLFFTIVQLLVGGPVGGHDCLDGEDAFDGHTSDGGESLDVTREAAVTGHKRGRGQSDLHFEPDGPMVDHLKTSVAF